MPASLSPWAHSEEASRAGSGSLLICLSWSPLGRELWWGGEKEVAFVAVLILRKPFSVLRRIARAHSFWPLPSATGQL